jgi:DNA invertase Pin-like site-specific DNA recombinase
LDRKITKTKLKISKLPKRLRVAAYARVSSGKESMIHSLSAQVSFYSKYIQDHSQWEYAGVYADEAVTGTKENRAEFERMIKDCELGKIDMIITKSISRFARNTVTLLETVRKLKLLNVDVYFEEQNIHSISSDGELMLTILASYAQEESLSVSENCKWRIRKNFKEGKLATHLRIYGYEHKHEKNSTLVVIPKEAKVIKMIFSDYLSGLGKNAIMKKLTKLGIPTKNGGQWCESTIDKILRNEKYTGNMILQKRFVSDHLTKRSKVNRGELSKFYVENSHEAIIDSETFAKTQEEIKRRAKKFKNGNIAKINCSSETNYSFKESYEENYDKNKKNYEKNYQKNHPFKSYPFTKKIVCEKCGKYYKRKINSSGTKYEKVIWICSTYNKRKRKMQFKSNS